MGRKKFSYFFKEKKCCKETLRVEIWENDEVGLLEKMLLVFLVNSAFLKNEIKISS
jgi:hypothetical protein